MVDKPAGQENREEVQENQIECVIKADKVSPERFDTGDIKIVSIRDPNPITMQTLMICPRLWPPGHYYMAWDENILQ